MRIKIFKCGIVFFIIYALHLYSTLNVEFAYIRSTHSFDFGTIHIFVSNIDTIPITITKIYLEDILLENLPNKMAIWSQILPNPVEPRGISDIMVRLSTYYGNYKLPIRVKIETDKGQILETQVEKVNGSFKITGICFNDRLDKIYTYVQNIGKKNIKIEKIYFGLDEVTSFTKFLPHEISPEKKTCIITTLPTPLIQGKYLSVKIVSNEGEVVSALVRVFSFFPITSWDGDTREELYFDPFPSHINFSLINNPEKIKNYSSNSAWYLLGCPNCTDRDENKLWGSSANEIIKRANRCLKIDPSRPSHTHVCEAFKEIAYFIYGEVCDIMFINPYEVVFHGEDQKKNGYFAKLGKLACEPRPLMTIPEAFNEGPQRPFPSPEEERLTIYYQISEGVKGISYFLRRPPSGYQAYPELEREIGRINKELQTLKPYLKIGEPFPNIATSSEPEILANTIMCGDEGIVVILINTDYKTEIKEGKRYTTFNSKEDFEIEVKIPDFLNIKDVIEIGQENKKIKYKKDKGKIKIPVDIIELTKVILIKGEQK